AGRGYVTAAVRALVPYVFEELRLHRLQAACLPENERSRAVLRKCGFTEEGIARGYLRINGAWRDHVVYAILRDDPRL
ncbi:GNAT family protein, partial [Parvibaculum sp.]